MIPTQRLVLPKLPTVLGDQKHVDLPGYEMWLYNGSTVHIVPGKLDVPTFEEALSKALQLYPHAAGRLRSSDGCYFVELTNTAVPMDIDYKPGASPDSLLNDNWVIQDDISPFLSNQPVGAHLVNSGAPLARVKLTFFNNETSIGIWWHHVLGDAVLRSRFTHTLSQFYQGLPLEHVAPSFEKYRYPLPPPSLIAEFWPLMPHLHDPYPFGEVGRKYAESSKEIETLRWRFDNHDLTKLRSTLCSVGQEEIYLSKENCLIAYLVAVLNRNRNIAVQKVLTTCSYRSVQAPFIVENVAGNLVQDEPATVPMDIVGIATSIRNAFVRCRTPDYLHNWMMVSSNHMLQTVNEGKAYFFAPHDDVVTVNSNAIIDWCSTHFGYPDGCRYYTIGVRKFNIRCFRSNPTKGDDGVWRPRQSIDVSFGLTAETRSKFAETLSRGIPHILSSEGIQM